jgi:hypothetical protein
MNQRLFSLGLSLVACSLLLLTGCQKRIRPRDLNKIQLGMTKQEVIHEIGEPTIYRGSMVNDFDQIVDVFEYTVDLGSTSQEWWRYFVLANSPLHDFAGFAFVDHLETYWLFFYNNILKKWCKAGDWETTQHDIQEIRFR